MIDFYKQFIGPDDLVFDIGSNIGEHAEVFAQIARKVIAVEPVRESFSAMCKRLAGKNNVVFVDAACGEVESVSAIRTSHEAPTIGVASMSEEWINAVKKTQRFGEKDRWDKCELVSVTTLDALMFEYGIPDFIKIDVEGYEIEVLTGLSQPVKTLSFEFTPETILSAWECISRCMTLGMYKFNLSLMEDCALGEWTAASTLISKLENYRRSNVAYGDIYARM